MRKYNIIIDNSIQVSDIKRAKYEIKEVEIFSYVNNLQLNKDINLENFTKILKENNPKDLNLRSAAPSSGLFCEQIETLRKSNDLPILILTISSGLSSTYNNAVLASKMYEDVHVLDTKCGYEKGKLLLNYLLTNIEEDKKLDDVIANFYKLEKKIDFYFIVNDLSYLEKNGRISALGATMSNLLKIKPILTLNESGAIELFAKKRTKKKAIDELVKIVNEKEDIIQVNVANIASSSDVEYFKSKVNENVKVVVNDFIPPLLMLHAGLDILLVTII